MKTFLILIYFSLMFKLLASIEKHLTKLELILRGKAKYNKKTNILTFPNEESIKIT